MTTVMASAPVISTVASTPTIAARMAATLVAACGKCHAAYTQGRNNN